jgi:uncharacterized protein
LPNEQWCPVPESSALSATERTRHRRLPEQGSTDRQDLHDILAAGVICHLGVIVDGRPISARPISARPTSARSTSARAAGQPGEPYPMVLPTVYGVDGDTLYLHGSVASRSLYAAPRTTICVTVTHVDGLVLARSVFEHAVNYRSAMIYGTPRLVTDRDEKLAGLRALAEHIVPGQWDYARRPNAKELAKTTLLALPLAEASVKIRTGPPDDGDSPDAALPVWAGVVPLTATWEAPDPDPVLPAGIPVPPHIATLAGRAAYRTRSL